MDNQTESKPSIDWLARIRRFMAIELEFVSTAEKLVATIGGVLGIILIAYISFHVTGASGAALIVPSMGASAVLVFAVPHGKLSQPWPLIGGNLVSAVIGVSCYKLIPDPFLAAGLAVGLAIGSMHLLSCIHPPGGATALAAVIGGPAINDLGYGYVISPILLNVTIIFLAAILFNSVFPWRRYPAAAMMRFTDQRPVSEAGGASVVDKHSIELALADMDLVMDVTTEDLQRVIQLSLDHARHKQLKPHQIKLGLFYTNGKHGPEWSVRRVIDESRSTDPKKDMVIYRVVEGHGFNMADSCTRAEFALWAAREVFRNINQ
ncbi:MAG: HPP family protein [Gammaproteobacteria bacterium]|jgi:CBS-domain-containing membrane protein